MFDLNKINDNTYQIYGNINGVASIKEVNGQKCWGFSIKFFKNKVLTNVSSDLKDGTIWNLDLLKDRIIQAYNN